MKVSTIVCTFFISGLSVVNAANLYVTKHGTGLDCSNTNPCGTIQAAVDLAAAGDQINIAKGSYTENVKIPGGKSGLVIMGAGAKRTKLKSAGGTPGVFAPAGVPADIIIDIFSPNVVIKGLKLVHPKAVPTKRDIGVFVRPPAANVTVENCTIKRSRKGRALEPTAPGSRGFLVFRAKGTVISNNKFRGNYEDHIHLPTSATKVVGNSVEDATRLGIVVIQESATSLSVDNMITLNEVEDSAGDGIQIQGDNNIVMNNEVEENGGAGIKLCGPASSPACVAPGSTTTASGNIVKNNEAEDNAGGGIVDDGVGNIVMGNEVE